MPKITQCNTINISVIPQLVEDFTDKSIPTDITDDEIDQWLAVIPDLISFWEGEAAEKKKELELLQHRFKISFDKAFMAAPEKYAIKMKETVANLDEGVQALAMEVITMKYELKLIDTLFSKVEHTSKSIHKIASLRARRLEVGVVAPSVRGDREARHSPKPIYNKHLISNELHQENRKELDDEF